VAHAQTGGGISTPAELILANARAALQLLIVHKWSGGHVSSDIVDLCKHILQP
jgi:hypothetical protein